MLQEACRAEVTSRYAFSDSGSILLKGAKNW